LTLRNLLPGALWLGFALGSGTAFLRHGSYLSLSMAAVNLFIAALFVFRRPDATPAGQASLPVSALAWIGTFLPFFLRPQGTLSPLPLALQIVGVIGIVLSLTALGRSFGVSPARRGVVTRGLYAWVRHPLYAAELLYFLGVAIAAPIPTNLVVWGALALVQWRRAHHEERCLEAEASYRAYLGAVRYRFLPGLL
jgi:protein-S-isoprenylcysteine O-methyltransferase Ste14